MKEKESKRNKYKSQLFILVPTAFLLLFILSFTLEMKPTAAEDLSNKARYDNYRLYRLHIDTEDQVKILQELEEKSDSYTFYGHARKPGQDLTIMVAAAKTAEIHEIMERYEISGQILVSPNLFLLICFNLSDLI